MADSEAELLLSDRFTSVETADLREARSVIERLQGPFAARPRTGLSRGPVHVRAASCGRVALSTFRFGTSIDIEPRGLEGAILVTTAVTGRAGMAAGGSTVGAGPGATFISQEEDSPTFLYEPDTEVLKLRFERRRFEDACIKMYDRIPDAPLRFHTQMTLPHATARWQALLRYVVARVNAPDDVLLNQAEAASMEELLMLTLLGIQPHSVQAGTGTQVRSVSPRQLRLAVEYIRQNLEAEMTLSEIAAAAGCSIRSLARAFQHASDTSPMQYVYKLRLQRIRSELLGARSGDRTIADIAYQWGYRHLGEFNRKYRDAFGETPSETRQRGRTHL
jgi:AraC-like DNA-binding protein